MESATLGDAGKQWSVVKQGPYSQRVLTAVSTAVSTAGSNGKATNTNCAGFLKGKLALHTLLDLFEHNAIHK
ncbi:hypothetical protein Tco_0002416 [Tanacetum coccineum]